ncbi:MAG: enolase C-terminal domain-like protein [Verrucomicrobiales bacterium]|nr:enolase C-terminal domain-like protein [Verrucomicrobiales bacterium]
MSELRYHRYELKSVLSLNAVSERTLHEGFLIRLNGGYGCVHPWPELGDEPVNEQLEILAAGGSTPLIDSALRCAKADGAARAERRSLFDSEIPESHWLALPDDDPAEARERGFNTVKLKLGSDFIHEPALIANWHDAGFRLRLDYNETLSLTTFLEFWDSLGEVRRSIQLIEDPVIWNSDSWRVLREIGVPVATDREVESRFHPGEVAVIKPAVSDWLPPGKAPFFVTSYMDHAIGQSWAAAEAARLAKEAPERFVGCGLLTDRCFESDPFFDCLKAEGPRFQPAKGTGLGFDDLLEGLSWKLLT